jgi:hypothetical protein
MGIAVDATSVYWVDTGSSLVMKAPLAGGAPTLLARGHSSAADLAVDATSVYWMNATDATGVEGTGSVMKVPLGGGTPFTIAPGQRPSAMVIDSRYAYWTNGHTGDKLLFKAPLAGGAAVVIAAAPSDPTILWGPTSALAIDATNIYWAISGCVDVTRPCNREASVVLKVPLGGAAPTVLATDTCSSPIAIDANSLYCTVKHCTDGFGWADGGPLPLNGQPAPLVCTSLHLIQLPLDGGAPRILASGPSISAVAVDAKSVYWANAGPGPAPFSGWQSPASSAWQVFDDANRGTVMKAPLGGLCRDGVCR